MSSGVSFSRAKDVPAAMMSIMVWTFEVVDRSASSLVRVGLGLSAIGLRRDPGKTMNETRCSSWLLPGKSARNSIVDISPILLPLPESAKKNARLVPLSRRIASPKSPISTPRRLSGGVSAAYWTIVASHQCPGSVSGRRVLRGIAVVET